MKKVEAEETAKALRDAGWDVQAQQSALGAIGWELVGKAADGDKPVYGFSSTDMKLLVVGGQVARLQT